uniref:Uncharacterized protein n=1 Tax=Rhizophora mucronata TaxID=61149 RepID=A0A2P2LAB7_RHIMU
MQYIDHYYDIFMQFLGGRCGS